MLLITKKESHKEIIICSGKYNNFSQASSLLIAWILFFCPSNIWRWHLNEPCYIKTKVHLLFTVNGILPSLEVGFQDGHWRKDSPPSRPRPHWLYRKLAQMMIEVLRGSIFSQPRVVMGLQCAICYSTPASLHQPLSSFLLKADS